jgi:hypothetical protein
MEREGVYDSFWVLLEPRPPPEDNRSRFVIPIERGFQSRRC